MYCVTLHENNVMDIIVDVEKDIMAVCLKLKAIRMIAVFRIYIWSCITIIIIESHNNYC